MSTASRVIFNLVALFHVVSGDDVGHMHGAAGFLQVNARRIVFAGGCKRTDGKRANVTERRSNFVGQSQTQEVYIFVGSKIL